MTAVSGPVRATFRAVAATVVPETVALDPAGWATFEAMVDQALAARTDRERRQLQLFLRLIEFVPLVTHRGRFSRLSAEQRTAVCRTLENSPHLLIRRGFWGLRTMAFLGYYAQPSIQAQLGYRAHRDGWSARRRSGEHAAIVADQVEPS